MGFHLFMTSHAVTVLVLLLFPPSVPPTIPPSLFQSLPESFFLSPSLTFFLVWDARTLTFSFLPTTLTSFAPFLPPVLRTCSSVYLDRLHWSLGWIRMSEKISLYQRNMEKSKGFVWRCLGHGFNCQYQFPVFPFSFSMNITFKKKK